MGWIIAIVIIGTVVYVFRGRIKPYISGILGGGLGGTGEVSQKKLDALDDILKIEKDKAEALEKKANLAQSIRDKQAAVLKERKRQAAARQKIIGRDVK